MPVFYPGNKMNIAISARMLKAVPHDGISRFTFEVVKRITINNPSHQFALIFDREYDRNLIFSLNTEGYLLKPATRHPLLWYYWHEFQLPWLLKEIKADIFLSPDGIISLRSDVPSVSVIHDINFYHRPKDLPKLISLYYRYFFRKFAQKSIRIITVSNFCKNDISSYLNIDPGSIDVAYNGVSEYFTPADRQTTDIFRQELTGGFPFFLFVGNFSPRKNIAGVIKAYHRFRSTTGLKHKLVLTGGKLFLNRYTDRLIHSSSWSDDIILTGQKIHEELRLLYASATALVFVPWFEGFGIPAAEAMRCGTPVILSNTTSLPEIGGEAAIYVSPGSTEEICSAMVKIATDENLRISLSKKGEEESLRFTWDNTTQCIWESIEKAAGLK
jgi:glycosyltransferase involved in cell wall biosynthesis